MTESPPRSETHCASQVGKEPVRARLPFTRSQCQSSPFPGGNWWEVTRLIENAKASNAEFDCHPINLTVALALRSVSSCYEKLRCGTGQIYHRIEIFRSYLLLCVCCFYSQTFPVRVLLASVCNRWHSRRCNFAQRMRFRSCELRPVLQGPGSVDIEQVGREEAFPPTNRWNDKSSLLNLESCLAGKKRCKSYP